MAIHKVTITITAISDDADKVRAYGHVMAERAEALAKHAQTCGGVFVKHEECETMTDAMMPILEQASESSHIEVIDMAIGRQTPPPKDAN